MITYEGDILDKEKVKNMALNLERIASKYISKDQEVSNFLASVSPLIAQAKAGTLEPIKDQVPGSYWFLNGNLSKYSDLEHAYSKFKIYITVGDDEKYKNLIDWAEKRKAEIFKK